MKTLRNFTLAAAAVALGIGAAFAQDAAKPAPQAEPSHRHGPHARHGHDGQHGCAARADRHQHPKDEKHEHDRR